MEAETKAALILESLPALQPGEAHRAIAAALTAAHADGANTYAHAALVTLAGAGVPTPERGYVADGGPEQLAADMRVGFDRAREDGRRAGLQACYEIALRARDLHDIGYHRNQDRPQVMLTEGASAEMAATIAAEIKAL